MAQPSGDTTTDTIVGVIATGTALASAATYSDVIPPAQLWLWYMGIASAALGGIVWIIQGVKGYKEMKVLDEKLRELKRKNKPD